MAIERIRYPAFMRQCATCTGLVPAAVDACPNCSLSRPPFKTLVATVALAVSTSCYSCLPYGAPPCREPQVDGGRDGCPTECTTLEADGGDPTKDPANPCSVDGGSP